MKVTIESDRGRVVTIWESGDDQHCDDVLDMCLDAVEAHGYHHDTIRDAVLDAAEHYEIEHDNRNHNSPKTQ